VSDDISVSIRLTFGRDAVAEHLARLADDDPNGEPITPEGWVALRAHELADDEIQCALMFAPPARVEVIADG
jgi:hypothetical protein